MDVKRPLSVYYRKKPVVIEAVPVEDLREEVPK